MVKDFGTADFDKVLEQLTTPVSVPNWFSVDTKAGVRFRLQHNTTFSYYTNCICTVINSTFRSSSMF